MWLKFIKDFGGTKANSIIWTDDNKTVQNLINEGGAIRCLGPDGRIFEDAAPEDIVKQLAAEDGISIEAEEKKIKKIQSKLSKEKARKLDLGQYIDDMQLK